MSSTKILIAALRNEAPFLIEWVAYHRVIGFSDIVLFHDKSIDGTSDLLAALAEGGALHAYENSGRGGHRNRAYERALPLDLVQNVDWAMALDTDEFLNIHAGVGKLDDLLAATPRADVISPSWRLFGHSGITQFEDAPLLDRFVQAAPLDIAVADRQYGLKSLFRPKCVTAIGPHRPVLASGNVHWVNGSGQDVTSTFAKKGWKSTPETVGYALAQINHYVIRSSEVFAAHNLHSPVLGSEPVPNTVADYIALNTNHATDQTIQRHAQAVRAEVARLRALPGVAQAHSAAVKTWDGLIATMHAVHKATPDSPVSQVLDKKSAKHVLRDQQKWLAKAQAPATKTPKAPKTTVIDTEDMAPRWLADLRRSDHRRGWYLSDKTFAAQFTARSNDVLIVSFDNLSNVNDRSLARETWGYGFYAAEGWSHLGVMAFEKNWYRDDVLFDFMERQKALFQQYKTVVMTGTSMGAYAATAFANLAPGCTVLAFSPQATLAKDSVPWEERFQSGRKQDWSGRYAHAPDHCDTAKDVFLIYDPYFEPDRRHADMYEGHNVHHLKSWYSEHKSALFIRRAEILKTVMLEAVSGALTPARYYEMFRARRDLVWYYNGLADHALARGHKKLAIQLANHLVTLKRPAIAQGIKKRM